MGPREHVAFLVGSANRVRILEALREQPYRQCELTEACDLSRSTAHRALDGLEGRGWVEQAAGEYRLTVGGDLVLARYEALETAIARIDEWGPFLNRVGDPADTLPLAALQNATLVRSTAENPHAAAAHFADALATSAADVFYGISPVVSPRFNEAAEGLIAAGTEMELIVDESVFDTSSTEYADDLDRAFSLDSFTLYVSPDDIGFGLTILDERAMIGAYDDRGVLRECLDTTDESLRAWAYDIYDDHRAAARRAETVVPRE